MLLRKLLTVVAIAAALAMATAGAASAAPAGDAHGPSVNWVGENPPDPEHPEQGGEGRPAILLILNFAVFLGLVVGFGGPALRRHMESRHTLIKNALDEAAKIRDEAQAKLEEYSKRIADVDREVDKLIADVRADAEAEKQRIIEEGRQQAERLKRDAESRIAAEFARARQEIEKEVVAAAVAAASRILREKTSPTDKAALVDEFISDIEAARPVGAPASPRGAS